MRSPATTSSWPPDLEAKGVPQGHHLIAWFGVKLTVPCEWNLARFGGDGRRGQLVLTDLRGETLRLRWRAHARFIRASRWNQRPPNWERGRRVLEQWRKRARRLAQRSGGTTVSAAESPDALIVKLPRESLLLACDGHRFYEMQSPKPLDESSPLVATFLNHLHTEPKPIWLWSIYGIEAEVSAQARLVEARFHPGAARLIFTHGQTCEAWGIFSLANELLKDITPRQLAEKYLNLARLDGTWGENNPSSHENSTTFKGTARRRWMFGHPIPFAFEFRHDQDRNQVAWRLTADKKFLKIWRS